MKIATFEGGQSSRLSPNLIQPNEAVKYVNVDNTRGILEPEGLVQYSLLCHST